jgi:biopolymer transport protein ExbB
MMLAELMAKGGPVMAVLLAVSIVALAIVLYKAVQLGRLRLAARGVASEAFAALEAGDARGAVVALEARAHPIARVMRTSVLMGSDPTVDREAARSEVVRVGTLEVRALESWLRGLSAAAHLSPLLGLLGTVFGMIEAFMNIEGAGDAVSPAILAGGVWEALLTTAFGLTVAIPSMAAYYLFEGEVDRIRAAMQDASTRVLMRFGKGEPEDTALMPRVASGSDYGI